MAKGQYDRTFRRLPLPIPIEKVGSLYGMGLSVAEISRLLDFSASILYNRMKEAGIEMRTTGFPPGAFEKPPKGNFGRYPVEAYREPPCKQDYPFCAKLRDYFRKKDGLGPKNMSSSGRIRRLWDAVKYGDTEE